METYPEFVECHQTPFNRILKSKPKFSLRRVTLKTLSLCLCFGMILQQSRADYWLVHGLTVPEHIQGMPSWFSIAIGRLSSGIRLNLRRVKSSLTTTALVPVADKCGPPCPWQSADAAGPFSIVNLANGNLFTAVPIVSWDGVSFALFHNSSEDRGVTSLGSGWSHSYSDRLEILDGETPEWSVIYHAGNGSRIDFVGDPDQYDVLANRPYRLSLKKVEESSWRLFDEQGNSRFFNANGRLEAISNASGNETKLIYFGAFLARIVDSAKRTLDLDYDPAGRLIAVTAPPLGANGNVQRMFEFHYGPGFRLDRIYSPRRADKNLSNPALFHIGVTYTDSSWRLKLITDYENNATSFVYHPTAKHELAQVSNPPTFDFVLNRYNAAVRTYSYTYDNDNITSAKVTNERGGKTNYSFDTSGRLTDVADPLGRPVLHTTWNTNNRPKTITNAMGGTTSIDYYTAGEGLEDNYPHYTRVERGDGVTIETNTEFDPQLRLVSTSEPYVYPGTAPTAITYQYGGDPFNSRRPTAIVGPGDLIVAGGQPVNQLALTWGQEGSPEQGLLKRIEGPNRNFRSFNYENRNMSGTNESSESNPCGDRISGSVNSITGEPVNTGERNDCSLDPALMSNRATLSGDPLNSGPKATAARLDPEPPCIDPADEPVSCDVCCCEMSLDEMGNIIDLNLDDSPFSRAAENPSMTAAVVLGCPGDDPFVYDGNNRLICAEDFYLTRAIYDPSIRVRYDLAYDERGRFAEMQVEAPEFGANGSPEAYPHVWLSPRHKTKKLYSDSTGQMQTVYFRDSQWGDHYEFREVKTTYRTDLAGRVSSIIRNGKATTYTYSDDYGDAQVTETRPDGGKTKVYLWKDGTVEQIFHLDSSGGIFAKYEYARDAKGRVISSTETIKRSDDPSVPPTKEVVTYTYGDGNLTIKDLDLPTGRLDLIPVPNPDKLYYAFLAELGGGIALASGDPNRLVSERRVADNPAHASKVAEFHREYWYDQGGNRLVMRESNPRTGEVQSVTRYNFFYSTLTGDQPGSGRLPGTPLVRGPAQMDYAGHGRDRLLSSQKYYPANSDRVDVTEFIYPTVEQAAGNFDAVSDQSIVQRNETTWLKYNSDGPSQWYKSFKRSVAYDYFNGHLAQLDTMNVDTCPDDESCFGPTDEDPKPHYLQTAATSQRLEYNSYDIFGRRVNYLSCDRTCEVSGCNPEPEGHFQRCKFESVNYNYDGLSSTVVAEHRGSFLQDYENLATEPYYVGDRFVATYLYGPLGPIARTAEFDNNNAADNRDTYYLRDGMGGHTGLLTDADDNPATAPQFSFSTYDAFGNAMSPGRPPSQAGSFAWRGAEGSVYDAHPTLVYMQARHYDPTIGRFIQPDSLALASMTTQGMNKYIYCENDPVTFSDPRGTNPVIGLIIFGLILAGIGSGIGQYAAGGSFLAGFGAGVIGGLAALSVAAVGPAFLPGSLLAAWLFGALGNSIGALITAGLNGCDLATRRRAAAAGLILGLALGWLGPVANELDTEDMLMWLLFEVDVYWATTPFMSYAPLEEGDLDIIRFASNIPEKTFPMRNVIYHAARPFI